MSQAPDTPPAEHQQARPPTVDDALTLARVGMPIIPLKPSTKEARFRDWQKLYSTNQTVIDGWWRQCPGANVGYVIPRGVLVVDVDPKNGGLVGWKNLLARHGDVPTTWRVWSGGQEGGFHLYFTVPDDVAVPWDTYIDMGVQVLGHRHLVVLPPSLHPDTGQAYQWDEAHTPFTMPTAAAAPDWLMALTLETAKRHAQKKKLGGSRTRSEAAEAATDTPRKGGRYFDQGEKGKKAEESGVPPPRPTPGSSGAHPLSKGYGDHASTLLRNPVSLPTLRTVLGFPEDLQDGMSVHCPCPEHSHGDRSASGVWREPKGNTLDYGVWCNKAHKHYTLNELFHFREGSALLQLRLEVEADGTRHEHRRLFLMWGLRLLECARLMRIPKEWGYPMLPRSAPEDCQTLWPVMLEVKRFRNATEHGSKEPLPLSYDFLRDWSPAVRHWGHKRMQEAFTWLVSKRFLLRAGKFQKGVKKMSLWFVGGLRGQHARKDAPVERTIDKAVESVEATPVPVPTIEQIVSDQTPACPFADVRDSAFNRKHCEHCAQAYLEEKRRLYGRSTLKELPNIDWEPLYAP